MIKKYTKKTILDRIALDIKRGGFHTPKTAIEKAAKEGIKIAIPLKSLRKRINNIEFIRVAETSNIKALKKIADNSGQTIMYVKQKFKIHYPFWFYFEKGHLNEEEAKQWSEVLKKKGWEERDNWPPRQAEFTRFRIDGRNYTGWVEPSEPFWNLGKWSPMHQEELPDCDQDREEMVAAILEIIQERARDAVASFNASLEEARAGESFGFVRSTLACQDAILHLSRF